MLYKAISTFIDAETKLKIVLDGTNAPEAMTQLFHPSQLEEKFGGTAKTPTNYWPPFMSDQCVPDDEPLHEDLNLMTPERYESILAENPELYVHPSNMKPERCNSMHFKLPEPEPAGQP